MWNWVFVFKRVMLESLFWQTACGFSEDRWWGNGTAEPATSSHLLPKQQGPRESPPFVIAFFSPLPTPTSQDYLISRPWLRGCGGFSCQQGNPAAKKEKQNTAWAVIRGKATKELFLSRLREFWVSKRIELYTNYTQTTPCFAISSPLEVLYIHIRRSCDGALKTLRSYNPSGLKVTKSFFSAANLTSTLQRKHFQKFTSGVLCWRHHLCRL